MSKFNIEVSFVEADARLVFGNGRSICLKLPHDEETIERLSGPESFRQYVLGEIWLAAKRHPELGVEILSEVHFLDGSIYFNLARTYAGGSTFYHFGGGSSWVANGHDQDADVRVWMTALNGTEKRVFTSIMPPLDSLRGQIQNQDDFANVVLEHIRKDMHEKFPGDYISEIRFDPNTQWGEYALQFSPVRKFLYFGDAVWVAASVDRPVGNPEEEFVQL